MVESANTTNMKNNYFILINVSSRPDAQACQSWCAGETAPAADHACSVGWFDLATCRLARPWCAQERLAPVTLDKTKEHRKNPVQLSLSRSLSVALPTMKQRTDPGLSLETFIRICASHSRSAIPPWRAACGSAAKETSELRDELPGHVGSSSDRAVGAEADNRRKACDAAELRPALRIDGKMSGGWHEGA